MPRSFASTLFKSKEKSASNRLVISGRNILLLLAAAQISLAEASDYIETYFSDPTNSTNYKLSLLNNGLDIAYFLNITNDGQSSLNAAEAAEFIIKSCNGTIIPTSMKIFDLIKEIFHFINIAPGTGTALFESFWRTANSNANAAFEQCIADQMDSSMIAKDETTGLYVFTQIMIVIGCLIAGAILMCAAIILCRHCGCECDFFKLPKNTEKRGLLAEQMAGNSLGITRPRV